MCLTLTSVGLYLSRVLECFGTELMALGVCDKGLQWPPYVGVCHGLIVLTQVSGNVWWRVKSVDEEIGLPRRNNAVFVGSNNQRSAW